MSFKAILFFTVYSILTYLEIKFFKTKHLLTIIYWTLLILAPIFAKRRRGGTYHLITRWLISLVFPPYIIYQTFQGFILRKKSQEELDLEQKLYRKQLAEEWKIKRPYRRREKKSKKYDDWEY
jgi:hypothetical protein